MVGDGEDIRERIDDVMKGTPIIGNEKYKWMALNHLAQKEDVQTALEFIKSTISKYRK